MPQDTLLNLSPRDIVGAVLRHWKKGTAVFLIAVTAVTVMTLTSAKAYRSEGRIFIRLGRENAVLDAASTGGQGSVVTVPYSREEEINSVVEVLKSRGTAEKVANSLGPEVVLRQRAGSPGLLTRLGLTPDLSPHEKAVVKLQKKLGVERLKKSNVVAIRYEAATPELAQQVVATFIDVYLRQHVESNHTPGAQEFFAGQSAELAKRLTQDEDRLRELKDKSGLVSVEERRRIIETRIGRLEDELLTTSAELAAKEAEASTRREMIRQMPETMVVAETSGLAVEAVDGMREQLYTLETREQELLTKYSESHLEVVQVHQQAEALRKILGAEKQSRTSVTKGPNRAREEAEVRLAVEEPNLAMLRARSEALRTQVVAARSDLIRLNDDDLQLSRLQREVALADAIYRRHQEHLEDARLNQALESQRISNISTVQPASLERKPAKPQLAITLGLGVLCAACLAVGVVGLSEYLDRSLKSAQDTEDVLGVPALVSIPRLRAEPAATSRTR